MGYWNMEITFSLKSKELSEIISQFISKRKKPECNINVSADNIVSGIYYSHEFDDYDNWEPLERTPGGGNVVRWMLEVWAKGLLITKRGLKVIEKNADSLDESLNQYDIIHHNYSPESENYVAIQKYDGNQIIVYEMMDYHWKSMWDKSNITDAITIFEKYGMDIDEYSDLAYFRDTLDYIKDKPIFSELVERFANKTFPAKRSSGDDEIFRLQLQIDELIKRINLWVVSPDEVNYEGLRINNVVYDINRIKQCKSKADRMKLYFFVESCISQLGAIRCTGMGITTDITLFIRDFDFFNVTDNDICKYYHINSLRDVTYVWGKDPIVKEKLTEKEYQIGQLAVYKEYLESFLNLFIEINNKRLSKKNPKPSIIIMPEDTWFNYLIKLDNDPEFHKNRQEIAKNMIDNSPYVGNDQTEIDKIYKATIQGRNFEL